MPLTRYQTIEWLLKTFNEAQEPLQRGTGGGFNSEFGDRLLLMPKIWHEGSYKEVEKALSYMKENRPSLYWHVSHRYLRAETTITTRKFKRRGVKGTYTEVVRVVEERWNPKVDPEKVKEGVLWLSEALPARIWLPKEILEVAGQ